MKIQRIISAITLAFALLFNQFGPASAKPQAALDPDCSYTPDSLTVELGELVQFHITNPDNSNSYMWIWGDGTESLPGTAQEHAWYGLGKVRMYVVASGSTGFNRCYSWVTVIAGNDTGMGGGMNFPTETPPSPVSTPIVIIVTDEVEIARGRTEGDGSPIINNSGDNNPVTITINQIPSATVTPDPTSATPVVPNMNCSNNSGYNGINICAEKGSTVNLNPVAQATPVLPAQPVVKTVAKSGFWTFIRMLYAPLIILDQWIVQYK